jgi:hypothetical protein
MRSMSGYDHLPAAFLLAGCNCRRVCDGANTLDRFSDDLLYQRNDRAPKLRVADSSVCPYQRDPIGCREKSDEITRYRRPAFWAFREMTLACRPLKEKRHWYPKNAGQLMKAAGANAVGALLVLLDLLERQSQTIGQLRLTEVEHKSTHADAAANMVVYRVTPLVH